MSLTEDVAFDKDGHVEPVGWRELILDKPFLSIIIILVAVLSFGIGRLSVAGNREAIRIEYDSEISNYSNYPNYSKQTTNSNDTVITSKNGSKYHYSHCAGAKQIKEENKISFASASAAEAAGYALAANCKSP